MTAVNNLTEKLDRTAVPEDTYCQQEMVERDLLCVELFTPTYRAWLYRAAKRCGL